MMVRATSNPCEDRVNQGPSECNTRLSGFLDRRISSNGVASFRFVEIISYQL